LEFDFGIGWGHGHGHTVNSPLAEGAGGLDPWQGTQVGVEQCGTVIGLLGVLRHLHFTDVCWTQLHLSCLALMKKAWHRCPGGHMLLGWVT